MEELLLKVLLNRTYTYPKNLITWVYLLYQKALTSLVEMVDSCMNQFSLDYINLVCD